MKTNIIIQNFRPSSNCSSGIETTIRNDPDEFLLWRKTSIMVLKATTHILRTQVALTMCSYHSNLIEINKHFIELVI